MFKLKRAISICIIFFSYYLKINASLRWQKIETEHYNLIYRENFEKKAQEIANTLEYLYPKVNKTLEVSPSQKTVYIDNESLISNGSTTLNKVILFSFPSGSHLFVGGGDWMTFLASHELRHIAQYYSQFKGLDKFFYYTLGGSVFLSNYNTFIKRIPSWFYEGDAVCIETALSKYGRLSFPSYLMSTKAILLEGPDINYHQAFYGSNIRKIPNQYPFGSVMVAHMRRKYGVDVIKKILLETTLKRPVFHIAVKKVTGKYLSEIYEDAKNELRFLWKSQLEGLAITESEEILSKKENIFLNYFYPQSFFENNILALKSDKRGNCEIVDIDLIKKKENRIHTFNLFADKGSIFSVRKNKAAWIEPRYSNLGYKRGEKENNFKNMVILTLERKKINSTKKYKDKIKKLVSGRFINLDLSEDESKIVVLESLEDYSHIIKILNSKTGKVIKTFKNPENKFYTSMKWIDNDKKIVTVISHKDKISLEVIDVETGNHEIILGPSYENIGQLWCYDKFIYYSSSYNGIDNIYAVHVETKKRYQITSKKYGAFSPSITNDGEYILFSNYQKNGLRIEKMKNDRSKWLPIEKVEDRNIYYHTSIIDQESSEIKQEEIPNKIYKSKKHFILQDSFHLSSWMPNSLDSIQIFFNKTEKVELKNFFVGFLFAFEDFLGYLKQEYNLKIYSEKWHWEFIPVWSFNKMFPLVKLKSVISSTIKKEESKVRNLNFEVDLDFPINTFVESFFLNIIPTIKFINSHDKRISLKEEKGTCRVPKSREGINFIYQGQLSAEMSKPKVGNYILNPYKFTVGAAYSLLDFFEEKKYKNDYSPFATREINNCWGINSKFYFPGFSRYDVFLVKNVYQKTNKFTYFQDKKLDISKIKLSNYYEFIKKLKFQPPNGYIGHIYGGRIASCFPIYYPDFAINHFAFFRSISMTVYGEYIYLHNSSYSRNGKDIKNILTFGVDLYSGALLFSMDNNKASNYELKIKIGYKYSPSGFDLERFNKKFSNNLCEKKVKVTHNSIELRLSIEKIVIRNDKISF